MSVSYESKRCNVVVLGVTGSGKSTVANRVLCHDIFPVESKPTSVTNLIKCEERVIEGPNKVMYSVKVVDTMGFADPKRNPDDTIKAIQKFFREKVVEGVSLVLFIMKDERVDEKVVEMIKRIKKHFNQISPMSALLITHCEQKSDDARKKIVKSFKTSTDQDVLNICTFMKKGIYTVGFPDLQLFREKFRTQYAEEMEIDVQTLHKVIYQSTEMLLTSEMFFDEKFWDTVKESEVPSSASGCSIM